MTMAPTDITPQWIDTEPALTKVLERFLSAPAIAFDSEGDGYFRYRSQLCTVQLATADEIVIVDVIATWHDELFRALLGSEGPVKIIHDMAYDARLLNLRGIELDNVFDTAIAARFLGEQATGLASLLEHRCDVELDKSSRLTDWARRPLTAVELDYLADDVRYLARLQQSLAADVERVGIVHEIAVETRYVIEQAQADPPPPQSPWLRIKGVRSLPAIQQAIIRELALVREATAEERNIPVSRVVHDKALLAVANKGPGARRQLGRLRLDKAQAQQAIDRALAAGTAPADELALLEKPSLPRAERLLRGAVKKALAQWRTAEATERTVDIQVVLPGHCMKDICATLPQTMEALGDIAGFGARRLERYGETIIEVISTAMAARQ